MKLDEMIHGFDGYQPRHICSISGGAEDSKGSGAQQSTQGFRDLPPEIQEVFKRLAMQAGGMIGNNTEAFTPLPQTAGETQAIGAINKGFTPDQAQLNADIALQTNPFDSSVIDTINREAKGAGSILAGLSSGAGQVGGKYSSNRGFLSANDIDTTRLNQIGQFKQGQFNAALANALTTLPQSRATDAAGQLQAGSFQRGLDQQTKQAPTNALAAIAQILGVLPTSSGQSTGTSSSESGGWNFGLARFGGK